MPRVSSPGELGIGRGAGKLGALNLPQRRSNASAETFGAGVRHFDQPAVGGVTIAPHYDATKSGFQLLAEAVTKVASIGSDTAAKVVDADNAASLMQLKLQASAAYTEQNLAREATVEEGKDPGDDYAKKALADFDTWSATQLEGLGGVQKLEMEQHYGNLKLHQMEEATNFQASRKRQYRQIQNEISADATREGIASAKNVVFNNPGLLGTTVADFHKKIDAMEGVADDVKADLKRDATGGLAGAAWSRKVVDDPYGARDLLQNGDATTLAGLEYKERMGLWGEADREIKRIEGEAKAAERERKAEARAARQDLAIAQGFQTAAMQDENKNWVEGIQVGRPADPAAYKQQLAKLDAQIAAAVEPGNKRRLMDMKQELVAANEGGEWASVAAGMPTPQLAREVEHLQTLPIDPDTPTPDSANLITAAKILAERQEALRAGKVLEYAQNSRILGRPVVDVDWHNPQSAVELDTQARKVNYLMTGVDSPDYQRLTGDKAAAIAEDINGSNTTDEVFAKLDGYMGRLDDAGRRAWIRELKEKKLSPLVEKAWAAWKDRGDIQGAREIVGAMTTKPEDMPKLGTDQADAINTAINERLTDPGSLSSLSAQDHLSIRQPATQRQAADDAAALEYMTKYYVSLGQDAPTASKNAERALYGDGPTAGNDDLRYVPPPQGTDATEFTGVLERVREKFMAPEFLPGPGVMPGQDMYRQSELTNIRNNGYFRKGAGDTYELIDPTSKRAVAVYTPRQMREIAGSVTDQPIIGY